MAQAAAVAKPPAPPRRRRASATPRRLPYLLIAPAALLMLGFIAYPVISVFYYSLQNYNPTKPWRNGYAGFDNFVQAFTEDPQFWHTLTFSAKWVVVEVGLQLLFGLALALIVNQTFVGRALGRALVFSPWAVSGVLTSAIWVLLYNSQTGVTRYLADMGIGSYGTSWLSDTSTVFPAAIVADLWRGVPFFAILILADLQSVSKDLYEAAEVDGASVLQQFRKITLPLLTPAILVTLIFRTLDALRVFDVFYVFFGNRPDTQTMAIYDQSTIVGDGHVGYGAAISVAIFLIIAVFVVIYVTASRVAEE
jgi:multiple sugar transport system permease protein